MKLKGVWIILLIAAGIMVYDSAFTVSETEQVVITQFGRIIGEPIREPGLKFKLPFLQKAHFFNKNILEWDGEPGQIPTLDKTFIWVDAFARWRIIDPVKFFQTVNNRFNAISRLNDIIDPAVRNFDQIAVGDSLRVRYKEILAAAKLPIPTKLVRREEAA